MTICVLNEDINEATLINSFKTISFYTSLKLFLFSIPKCTWIVFPPYMFTRKNLPLYRCTIYNSRGMSLSKRTCGHRVLIDSRSTRYIHGTLTNSLVKRPRSWRNSQLYTTYVLALSNCEPGLAWLSNSLITITS